MSDRETLCNAARDCRHIASEEPFWSLVQHATRSDISRAVEIMRSTGHRPLACLMRAVVERIDYGEMS